MVEETFHLEDIKFERAKVLIVDDVESLRLSLKELLNQVNLDVLEAQNGHEAFLTSPEYHHAGNGWH